MSQQINSRLFRFLHHTNTKLNICTLLKNSYSKPLAPFGLPISANHPEVAVARSQPVSSLVLNLVARLKEIGTQLARKSVRTPVHLVPLVGVGGGTGGGLLALSLPSVKTRAGTKSGDEPLAEARVSEQQGRVLLGAGSQASAELLEGDEQQLAISDHEAAASALVQTLANSADGAQASQMPQQSAGEDLEAPDGEAAESEGDHEPDVDEDSAEEASTSDGQSDDDNDNNDNEDNDDVPECSTPDCSDLLPTAGNNTNEHEQHNSLNGAELDLQHHDANNKFIARPHEHSAKAPVVIVPTFPSYPNEIFYTPPDLAYNPPDNYQVALGSAASFTCAPLALELQLFGQLLTSLALLALLRNQVHQLT